MSRLSVLLVIWAVLAAVAAAQTAFKPQTAPGVACFSYSSKYNYCFAVMASDANAKTTCAAKNPIGQPDTFATQTQCCKEKFGGKCGFSGGPSGRTCWMPDTATKKCKLVSLEATKGEGCNNNVGGFQSEAVCQAESFPSAGAAGGATTLPAVLPPAGGAAPATAAGVACFTYSSKYNYCFAVRTTDATAKTTCGTKTPGSQPDTFATQTQCCKEKFGGKCGFSGGPSGRTCWMPDTATKKCKLVSLEATKGEGCNNAVGGFQAEDICVAESFGTVGAAAAGGAAAGGAAATSPTGPKTAPGVACFSYSSKYNYCFAVMASEANAKTTCAAKNPIGQPDTFATQTQCCKEKFGGKCGFSGGPSGRTCWMPDTATKKCKLVSLEATKGEGCNNNVGGFQSEAVCVAESF